MTLLGAALLLVGTAGAVAGLAWLSRRTGRPWAALEALLLGPGAARRAGGVDLRFATFAAGVGLLLLGVLAALPAARALRGGTLGFALLLGLPALVGALAVLADLSARAWDALQARRAATGLLPAVLPFPTSPACPASGADEDDLDLELDRAPTTPPPLRTLAAGEAGDDLLALLDEARAEVASARALVQDPALLAALDALEESAVDYSHAAAGAGPEDPRVRELRARVEGVIALTRSCLDEDRLGAARLLGVRPGAAPDEVRDVTAALRGVYGGQLRLPGIDPGHLLLLERACERLCAEQAAGRVAA